MAGSARRLIAEGLAVSVGASMLTLGLVVSPAVGLEPVLDGAADSPLTPSNPLVDLDLPSDPADRIAGLPEKVDDLPADSHAVVAVGERWAEAPGTPVEVRVDRIDAGGPGAPASSETPTDSASPTGSPAGSPTGSPSGSPTVGAALGGAGVSTSPEPSSPAEVATPSGSSPDSLSGGVWGGSVGVAVCCVAVGGSDVVGTG